MLTVVSLLGCRKKIKLQTDELYSRHLQKRVQMTIITTPFAAKDGKLNLLLVNDGQDLEAFGMRRIMDSLYRKDQLQSLLVIGIHPTDRLQDYGVAGFPSADHLGSKADHYADFVVNELIPYARKKAEVRSFETVAILGCSLGGLSAFDIGWNNGNKIDKIGVFSGSFWWRDKAADAPDYDQSLNRIMIHQLQVSRKRPHQQYWFYAGMKEEEGDRDKDGVIDVVDDTQDLISVLTSKKVCSPLDIVFETSSTGIHEYSSWSQELPKFLVCAFGRK